MKSLTFITTLFLTLTVNSTEVVPEYLKGGIITVTLKDGKTYEFSADEYAVVKRGSKSLAIMGIPEVVRSAPETQERRHRHIISGELVFSNSGRLKTESTASTVNVETKKRIGVGAQYQLGITDDLYLGGRIDTNGGAGLNLGVGF
jgi:hypothetical protein